jgi:integrase
MAKQEGTRYGVKRRGERWQARPYIPGVGHVWAGTHDTEGEAEEAAKLKIAEHHTRPPMQETISSFTKRWIRDFPRPKESTDDSYNGAARRFREAVDPSDRRKLHEFTVPEAMAYARNHRYDVPALRAMYGDARREGLVREVPFSELRVSKGRGRKDIIAITAAELDLLGELIYECHSRDFAPVFHCIVDFAADTTMRPSEIFGLDRPDVDLKAEAVSIRRQFHKRRIQTPKNGKPRTLPYLPPRAAAAIRRLPRRVPPAICSVTGSEILFCGKQGQRISQSALWSYWEPVRTAFEASLDPQRRAELRAPRHPDHPKMDFYELRHFGATQMAEKGVEDWIGAAMMGHTDGGKLYRDTYSHPSDQIAAQRLKQAFGRNVQPLRPVEDDEEAANG